MPQSLRQAKAREVRTPTQECETTKETGLNQERERPKCSWRAMRPNARAEARRDEHVRDQTEPPSRRRLQHACSACVQLPVPFIRFMLLLREDIKCSSRAEAMKGILSLSKSIEAM